MTKIKIGTVSDFPPGEMKSASAEGKSLLVANVGGDLYAMDSRCSHMGMDLTKKGRLEENVVTCRMHGAQFDVITGEVLRNMQARKMNTYPVTVEDGNVFVDI